MMKTRKVEIEIPEDMEVLKVRNHSAQVRAKRRHDLVVELIQREPRRWIFEEIIDRKYINEGEYWTDSRGNISQALYGSCDLAEGQLALRKIEE